MYFENSYFPNYFAIDDILATQERVPCKFLTTIPGLGKLNPASDEKDLKEGTTLELPMWFVEEFATRRQPWLQAELPKIFREEYREVLKADANAVDLHKFCLYFYEFGSHVTRFDRRNDVAEILVNTFRTRFRQLMNLSEHSQHNPETVQKLDVLERKLLKSAVNSRKKLESWLKYSGSEIETSAMVVNHKKRKRI